MYNDCFLFWNVYKLPNSVSECSNKLRKEIQIIVYMWTKILYKGINKSNFSLHHLVVKRKEKQSKRNVKHDDVKTNVIYFRTINYCSIYSCAACLSFCTSKGDFGTIFCNDIFYILDHQKVMLSRHIILMRY